MISSIVRFRQSRTALLGESYLFTQATKITIRLNTNIFIRYNPVGKMEKFMDAMQFVPILLVGFAASLGFTPVSRRIAMRLGVVDKPNQRKIHQDHKPLMGGLAIHGALLLSLLL